MTNTVAIGEQSPTWGMLCDLVASDRLICFTGAGISSVLERKSGGKLPQWPALLADLLAKMKTRLTDEQRATCEALLGVAQPLGDMLIEAASILERPDAGEFERILRAAVEPLAGQTTDTHRALAALRPRGTVTLNYDDAHENAYAARSQTLSTLLPYEEEELTNHLRRGLDAPFLLKAHGSIGSPLPLVLTYASYRELLVRRPSYRAFMSQLLTNFSMLFIGFGMTDPDFDIAIRTLLDQFGAPIREHVIIRRADSDTNAQGLETLLRSRYGIHTLHVENWSDVPSLLQKTLHTPGPVLKQILHDAVYEEHQVRSAAHARLKSLGTVGKLTAQEVLRRMLTELEDQPHYLSETAYALGDLRPVDNKQILMDLVERELHRGRPDPPARALTVLRPALRPEDLDQLRSWIPRAEMMPNDPDHRVAVYLRYLVVYVRNKFRSDATRP